MPEEKTTEDIHNEITEQVKKVIGNINNFDSKKEKADVTLEVLNSIIAGVELSRVEKAGTLTFLLNKRVNG